MPTKLSCGSEHWLRYHVDVLKLLRVVLSSCSFGACVVEVIGVFLAARGGCQHCWIVASTHAEKACGWRKITTNEQTENDRDYGL